MIKDNIAIGINIKMYRTLSYIFEFFIWVLGVKLYSKYGWYYYNNTIYLIW